MLGLLSWHLLSYCAIIEWKNRTLLISWVEMKRNVSFGAKKRETLIEMKQDSTEMFGLHRVPGAQISTSWTIGSAAPDV